MGFNLGFKGLTQHRVIIPEVVLIQLSSWRWAQSCSKDVEDSNKHIIEEIVRQVGHLPEPVWKVFLSDTDPVLEKRSYLDADEYAFFPSPFRQRRTQTKPINETWCSIWNIAWWTKYVQQSIRRILEFIMNIPRKMPVPVAARSKAYVYGRSPAEIVSSNPTGGHGCWSVVSVVCCQVEVSCDELITRRRGVLPAVLRRCVWSRNLKNEEAMTRVGSKRHRKKSASSWLFTRIVRNMSKTL